MNGKYVLVSLDTGSIVNTLPTSLCSVLGLDIQPLKGILKIKGAGGHELLHSGFTEVKISFKGLSSPIDALMLVVPDTPYHERVPVSIGTSVLRCMDDAPLTRDSTFEDGSCFLDDASDLLGLLTTTKPIVIPSNGCITMVGSACKFIIHN